MSVSLVNAAILAVGVSFQVSPATPSIAYQGVAPADSCRLAVSNHMPHLMVVSYKYTTGSDTVEHELGRIRPDQRLVFTLANPPGLRVIISGVDPTGGMQDPVSQVVNLRKNDLVELVF